MSFNLPRPISLLLSAWAMLGICFWPAFEPSNCCCQAKAEIAVAEACCVTLPTDPPACPHCATSELEAATPIEHDPSDHDCQCQKRCCNAIDPVAIPPDSSGASDVAAQSSTGVAIDHVVAPPRSLASHLLTQRNAWSSRSTDRCALLCCWLI